MKVAVIGSRNLKIESLGSYLPEDTDEIVSRRASPYLFLPHRRARPLFAYILYNIIINIIKTSCKNPQPVI